jgi:hypothetical protein
MIPLLIINYWIIKNRTFVRYFRQKRNILTGLGGMKLKAVSTDGIREL